MGGRVRGTKWTREKEARDPAQQDVDVWKRQLAKDNYIVLGRLQAQLEADDRERNADRDSAHLHASSICKQGWCPRASWYDLTGVEPHKKGRRFSPSVAAEGNEIHDRYQKAFAKLGILVGDWKCLVCDHRWWAQSPAHCAGCGSHLIRYAEVPLLDESIRLLGHGDGLLNLDQRGTWLLEIKSIGEGSVRIEAPQTYQRYLDGELTLSKMWQAIRRPFPTHVRQVMLYLRALQSMGFDVKNAVVIYECKWNQLQKEFRVRYMPATIETIVDGALQVQDALEHNKVVKRPEWAEEDAPECLDCWHNKTCWGSADGVQATPVEIKKSVWSRSR